MKRLAIAVLVPALALLAGCQTTSSVSEAEYNRTATTLRLSKSQREEFYRSCIADHAAEDARTMKVVAVVAGTTPDRLNEVFCRRITDAIASGALTYKDYAAEF